MDDPLKQAAAQLEQLNKLLEVIQADRDQWKALAELTAASEQKLVALRETIREAMENSE